MSEIAQMVESFIRARRADGRAPRTIRDYRRVLEPFAEWCREQGILVGSLSRDHIREYVVALRERGWSEGTVAIHIRNLRSFLHWLAEEGLTGDNLARAVRAPRRIIREEEPLTPEEICALIAACQDGSDLGQRDLALILCFLDTGLRAGEMVLLRRSSVEFSDNGKTRIQVYAPKTKTSRLVFLGKRATSALREYLARRKDSDPALWMGESGRPLTAQGIYKIIRRRGKQAGIERLHPHIFRRSFATRWLDHGGDVERLRLIAGWRSLDMLPVYVRSAIQQLEEAHRRAGPVDRLLGEEEP